MFHPDWGGGIKKYGKRAVVDMLNEYKKLHNLAVLGPQDPALMSQKEQNRALQSINIIKEKR